jgi:alpha-ketoglutarate-dependent taurine dioxygenase
MKEGKKVRFHLPPYRRHFSEESLVEITQLQPHSKLPLLVKAQIPGIDLAHWASSRNELLQAELLEKGAILFRSFDIDNISRLKQVIAVTSNSERMACPDESTPRAEVDDNIYESTIYPAHQSIELHNEASYCQSWPRNIYFYCIKTARSGGATPLADIRRVTRRLMGNLTLPFEQYGIMYVRNFNAGAGLPWEKAFWTSDRAAVEHYCVRNDIRFEWRGTDGLRTVAIRPAFRLHGQTGEKLWFNHAAFFNIMARSADVRKELLDTYSERDLPFNTYYGNGSRIDPSIIDGILQAYHDEHVTFPWHNGDLLLLDNMLTAHGREPFEGDRRIVVAMTNPQTDCASAVQI